MKTTIELRREVAGLVRDRAGMKPTSKEFKALQKQIDHLRECILYLDTKPSPEFLQKEVKRLEGNIACIDKQFEIWITSQHLKVQAASQKAKKKLRGKGWRSEDEAASQNHRIPTWSGLTKMVNLRS